MGALLDLVIEGARVIDGTGSPWLRADVAVRAGRIAGIGKFRDEPAGQRIDAEDLVLTPGFIDSHVHSEAALLRQGTPASDLLQGVTTHVVGQDGTGFAPTDEAGYAFMAGYFRAIYGSAPFKSAQSVASFLEAYTGTSAVNVATLIPNGCVRHMVMGNEAREATEPELRAMATQLRLAMADGAVGVSTGLDYVPSGYASTAELAYLCGAIANLGAVYVSHVRASLGRLGAVEEAIEIGRRAGVPVHVSHLAPSDGVSAADLLGIINAARRAGTDVTFDMYPYLFGCTTLLYLLPLAVLAGSVADIVASLAPTRRDRIRALLGPDLGSWAEIELAGDLRPEYAHLIGADVLSAARLAGADPVDFVCDLLLAHRLDVLLLGAGEGRPGAQAELESMLAHPAHTLCSDGVYASGRAHPRVFGAFARFLGPYVRDSGRLTLEEAVRHATSAPARRFGLADRGLLRPGMAADMVLFDPDSLCDRATKTSAMPATGVRQVWVNGVAVVTNTGITGATPGRGLRRSTG